MDSVASKACRKCGQSKPLAGFHKQASRPDGHQSYCRECNTSAANARKAERRKADPLYAQSLSDYKRAHYAANREHDKAASQAWRAANPDRVALQKAEYKTKHPDRLAAAQARYRLANREARREAFAVWAKANPIAVRNIGHRRRVRLANQTVVVFNSAQIGDRMAFFGFACWMCGGPFEAIDHVKPVSKRGPHMLSNLRPACRECNSRKHAKWYGVAELHRFIKN